MMMHEQIAELERFDARGERVLSLYLDIPPARHLKNALRAAFEDLAKGVKSRLDTADEHAKTAGLDELARIETALGSVFEQPQGKGLVVFSCESRGLWQAEFLPVSVQDHIAFERWADVAPLTAVLDDNERYAVALVDKTRARLFTVFAGAIEGREVHREVDVPPKHDQGGMSQSNYQRHHEAHVLWHVKDVVERLQQMAQERPFERLVLAGPVEAITELRDQLPHPLAERLVDVIHLDADVSEAEVLDKTRAVVERVEREAEQRVVDTLIEADVHKRGTRGLAPTLRALYLRDVQTLVVADGVAVPGFECPNPLCGLLERINLETCPACGTTMEPVHDVVHRAMARALGQAGRVEVVHGEPAKTLERHGGVGAILRFPNPLVSAGTL